MSIPLVTIAIPTYNRADKYLRNTLESALGQTYTNIEILVSDNCSTDQTPELIRSYSDDRLTYYRQEKNLGQRGNMNFLVEKARGDYFLMLHDDDLVDQDFVETCMKAAAYKAGKGLILTGSRVMDQDGRVLRTRENTCAGFTTEELILAWYKKKVNMFFCSSLFGTEALRQAGGFQDTYNHYDDVAAEFKCSASHGRIDVKDPKANFRKHTGSFTSPATIPELINWCDSSLALLWLSYELAPSKKKELQKYGVRTSAERVYRYAKEADSTFQQLKGYWTVYKRFNYKQPPTPLNWYELFPVLEYFKVLVEPKRYLYKLKN